MPENISKLENLEILDVSNNLLKSLPETLGNLTKLKRLNISGNSSIQYLPKSICKAQRLVMLELDIENLLYPPKVVAENGIESIMRYICNGKIKKSFFIENKLINPILRYWLYLCNSRNCRRNSRSR